MRYYVICQSDLDGIAPHILAEVVGDRHDDETHPILASTLASERRVVVTRDELLGHPFGVEALEAWDAQDDSAHDDECAARRARGGRPHRGLRLVKNS